MIAIGDKAPSFTLPDTAGSDVAFPDGAATVVVFTCNHCPYALAWHDRLLAVARDYGEGGVPAVLVTPNDASASPATHSMSWSSASSARARGRRRTCTTSRRRS